MKEYDVKFPIESIQDAYEYKKERIFHTIARLDEAESSLSRVIEILSKDGVTREALEEAIDLLEHEVRYNERGFWLGSVYVSQDNEVTEAIKILKGIIKLKGE